MTTVESFCGRDVFDAPTARLPCADLYPQIAPTVSQLSQRLGRGPSASEIANELGADRQDVVEAMTAGAGTRGTSRGNRRVLGAVVASRLTKRR